MSDWRGAIDAHIETIAEDLRSIRRHLHTHPELSRQEFQTTRFLASRLEEAGIPFQVLPSGRGIIAGPDTGYEVPRVAFRADMDALPLQDRKETGYRSACDGVMHACGHDAHSTMALGAALALRSCRDRLPWPVAWRALFQPAEEVGEGALEMVAAGAVEGVDSIVALHVAPEYPVGRVGLRRGIMTAFCQEFGVEVRGSGGHAARPHTTIDPIAAAAQLITAVYQTIPRSFDAREPVVVSFGAIEGGNTSNVIPDRVALQGTIRTLGRAAATRIRDRLARIAQGVAELSGAEIVLNFGSGTDAVVNDPIVSAVCKGAAAEVVGGDHVEEIPLPSMGGEDFSGYLDHARGCLIRVGVANGDQPWPSLHSPHFDIDERALLLGARILARSAVLLGRPVDGGEG